jgi:hypothetical protein
MDGSRSCWRLEAEAAPQNKLARSAEPHSQLGRLARDAKKGTLRIHLQPASHSSRRQSQTVPRVKCECARDAPVVSSICCHLKCGALVRRVRKLQSAAARSPFTMAPKRGLSIERTTEYEDFMKDLAAFHEKRGYVT